LNRSVKYVGTADRIDVYRTEGGQKRKLQTVASRRPTSLTLDSARKYLFALNEVDTFEGLPTGSIESYRIEPETGHLKLVTRTPLSLSATMPRQFALSPDGRFLVVAVYGGGLYNVLPLSANGEIGHVTQAVKEIGCSVNGHRQSSAHPHSVVFHPSGRFLFGTDEGADRVNVFGIDDEGQMTCVHRASAAPGSGPAGLTVDLSGSQLTVAHAFSAAIGRYAFDSRSGLLAPLRA
jgi:6-phosphogluconolactonase (cycloisomerase 2 family)